MTAVAVNSQQAPYPDGLAGLVETLTLPNKPGWSVSLANLDRGQGSVGLTLSVLIDAPDAYHPEEIPHRRVVHYFPVPPAAYDVRSWRRWLFSRLADVDTHELCEGFTIGGDKPYAPSHGPGNDPYLVREVGTSEDVRTSYRGEVKPQ